MAPKFIFLARHCQSKDNVLQRLGGNSSLSVHGKKQAQLLRPRFENDANLKVWTSELNRAVETAEAIGRKFTKFNCLNEINAGVCDGMTYVEIHKQLPIEFEKRSRNKFLYKYPKGESYQDIVCRLQSLLLKIFSIKNDCNLLIITHQAVFRMIFSLLTDQNPANNTNLRIEGGEFVSLLKNKKDNMYRIFLNHKI
eukprot:COSAG01_NODE_330_length_18723_cov_96.763155_19_plen_196_part_00